MSEYIDATKNHNPTVHDPNDDRLMVEFSQGAVFNEHKTVAEGRPIYDTVDWIRIVVPGSRDTVEREVRPSDHTRFPKQWLAYKAGKNQDDASGTPLTVWPAVTRAQVEELRFFGVRTVEQLAGIADSALAGFMGGQQLRQKAKDFIAAAAGEAPLSKMRADIEARDAEIAAMKAQIADLAKNKK